MRFTVYKTTNKQNGKVYIGVHATEDPHDTYLGSGHYLKIAIRKYGRAAFSKEILHDFDTPEEMFAAERSLVTKEFCKRRDTYNLLPGGEHPFEHATSEELSAWCQKGNKIQRRLAEEDPSFRDPQREAGRRNFKKAHAEGKIAYDTFTGRKHSDETKAKMSKSMRVAQAGHRNSQYGTAWVCREGEIPRKVPKVELPTLLKEGWQRGRKVKP